MPIVSVRNLVKRYGEHVAVADVSFDIEPGEVVAVLGPNGAGKTTTVEILEGFRKRSGGEVSVLGQDPGRAGAAWRAKLGLVLQSTSLDPELTVRETLELYGGFYPAPRPVDEVLRMVGLEDEAGTRVGQLSGGQQRRVDLGVGVVGDPRLLFLDEPTTGFDPAARRKAWQTVQDLSSGGVTVLLTTHYLEEARRLADRIIVLARGRVVADGPPEQVAQMVGAGTHITFRLDDDRTASDLPPRIAAIAETRDGVVSLRTTEATALLATLLDWSREAGAELTELTVTPADLEDVYISLIEDGNTAHV